jgi:predicted amidophosphoribosyltransferase
MVPFEIKPADFLRACAACGGMPLKIRKGPFCGFCEKFFLKNAGLISRAHENWSAHSLWRWETDDSVVGEVIRRLKGGGDENVYDYFAQIFLQQWFMAKGRITKEIIVIPAPARESDKKDHAFCFARSLAKQLSAEFISPLLRPSAEQQKLRNKLERREQIFTAKGDFAAANKLVVFVDDVIVTGGTIDAAYIALNSPKNFLAWCLADRMRLC